jgi:hypothetical protein
MAQEIELLDIVALMHDLPEHQLVRGQVGTIVERLAAEAFEVEFVDDEGRTYAMLPLKAEELILLHHKPLPAR